MKRSARTVSPTQIQIQKHLPEVAQNFSSSSKKWLSWKEADNYSESYFFLKQVW